MNFAIIIPAQEKNRYHEMGDLAPFGDTTLLEWKIAQCKEFAKPSHIYISSESKIIEDISKKECVNFLKRPRASNYIQSLCKSMSRIDADDIICTNTTSPFLGANIYKKMYEKYKSENLSSLVSVEQKKEYVFFDNKKLNFGNHFVSRANIEPIYIITNGCYIIDRKKAIYLNSLIDDFPRLFELDAFAATEIKYFKDYSIAREMISLYFRKVFDA